MTQREQTPWVVLREIQQGCAGLVELRAIPTRAQAFARIDDLATLRAFVTQHRDSAHLYWGVATRRDSTSGRADNCLALGALFADLDFAKHSEQHLRSRLAGCQIPPSIVIHSGGGLHAYWLLDTPMDVAGRIEATKTLLRRLARAVDGDLAVAEVARVLRVPNTLNHKHQPPALVSTETFEPTRRYAVEDIDRWLPHEPPVTITRPAMPLGTARLVSAGDRYERGRAYLAAMGPAIEGRGGDPHTYRAACWLVCDLALDEHDALSLLREWNVTCCPPWTDVELQEKVRHAKRYGRHPLGAALVESESRNRVVTVRVQVP